MGGGPPAELHLEADGVLAGGDGPPAAGAAAGGAVPRHHGHRLAGILHVNSSTLTGVLKRLEQRGYVARHEDPRDARQNLLSLTAAGRALDTPTSGTVEDAVQRLLGRVPLEHLTAAQELLTVLAQELHTHEAPGGPENASPRPEAHPGPPLPPPGGTAAEPRDRITSVRNFSCCSNHQGQ